MFDESILEVVGLVGAAIGFFFVWWRLRSIEEFKSSLQNQNKMAEELRLLRSAAHSEIWTLTGALKLFGPCNDANLTQLSRKMADWYFTSGEALGTSCRDHYFILQEVMGLCLEEKIEPRRPANPRILGAMDDLKDSAIKRLDKMRSAAFGATASQVLNSDELVDPAVLRALLNEWRVDPGPKDTAELGNFSKEERAWILLQWLMSLLRSRVRASLTGERQS